MTIPNCSGSATMWYECISPAGAGLFLSLQTFAGMTSVDNSAAPFDPTAIEPRGWSLRRLLAPFAIGLALLLAFLTFVVLTGLTRIAPTREVAVSFILMNGATILVLLGIIF